ncbi:unnamed protein product [Schistosoma turkestanicum]|nr:unnamed protein product [Schistosoma turkestanicum]
MSGANNTEDVKENLLKNVKIQVKKLMEEAVIRGYVHEDSETIGKLCSSVEAVLLYKVRRSIFTWMEEESTYVLCQKIAKLCPEAQQTLDRLNYYKDAVLRKRNDYDVNRPVSSLTGLRHKTSRLHQNSIISTDKSLNFSFRLNDKRNSFQNILLPDGRPDTVFQNFWIRIAIYEKVLDKIVKFLADNTLQYYESGSIIADPCDGQLLSDLLRGPCTIDYSHTRRTDHLYTDPPVSELIQRRGIYSNLMCRQFVYRPPISQNDTANQDNIGDLTTEQSNETIKTNSDSVINETVQPLEQINGNNDIVNEFNDQSVVADDHSHGIDKLNKTVSSSNRMAKRCSSPMISANDLPMNRTTRTGSCAFLPQMNEFNSMKSNRLLKSSTNKHIALAAKDHVESMHQSIRTHLLYGKNNVMMQPPNSPNPIPGYLSLIDGECGKLLILKWTPNSAVTTTTTTTTTIPSQTNTPISNQEFHFSTDSLTDSKFDVDDLNEKETYWGYAVRIKLPDIIYGHYHEYNDQYTLTLIRTDGIQLAPFHFCAQSHVLTFLNCLEQGLKQRGGYLDPSSELETSSPVTPNSATKSYRPSMPLIFVNQSSLLPSTSSLIANQQQQHHSTSSSSHTTSSIFNKPSRSSQSVTSLTSSSSSGLKQRIYMNILKAFNHTDDMNTNTNSNEQEEEEEGESRRTHSSSSIPEEKLIIPHVFLIVSKTRDSHTHMNSPKGIINHPITSPILPKRISLEGISEETINESNEMHGQLNSQISSQHENVFHKLRMKLLSHVFRKWYNYFKKIRIVRKKLTDLVSPNLLTIDSPTNAKDGITIELWNQLMTKSIPQITFNEFCRHIYFGNCDPTIRNEVWPYLLGLYTWNSTIEQLNAVNMEQTKIYTNALHTWLRVVEYLKQDVRYASFVTTVSSPSPAPAPVVASEVEKDLNPTELLLLNGEMNSQKQPNNVDNTVDGEELKSNVKNDNVSSDNSSSMCTGTTTLLDITSGSKTPNLTISPPSSVNSTIPSQCEFSPNTLELFATNLYRIDKDVTRCDRNHTFFMSPKKESQSSLQNFVELNANLIKLRNIISTWVWLHLDIGYIQGMCDLLAPILIIFQNEIQSFACFNCLMKWMLPNFPTVNNNGSSQLMDTIKLTPNETLNNDNNSNTITNNNDSSTTRTTLLQLAVKAARRRTITKYSQDDTTLTTTNTTDNDETLGCTNKLKERSLSISLSTPSSPLQKIIDLTNELMEQSSCPDDTTTTNNNNSSNDQNSDVIKSPYDKLLFNSTDLSIPCMDLRFSFLQSLIEIFDPEMNNHLAKKLPEGQLFFSYRWLLLDFKRELQYDDIFPVWETIWASRRLVTYDFGIFFALALIVYYRDIIIYYNMDITEIIRFYNELTEQHDCVTLLELARSYVFQLQHLLVDE